MRAFAIIVFGFSHIALAEEIQTEISFIEDGKAIATSELSLTTYTLITDGRILVGLKHVKNEAALHAQLAIIQVDSLKIPLGATLAGDKLQSVLGTDRLLVVGRKSFNLSNKSEKEVLILAISDPKLKNQTRAKGDDAAASPDTAAEVARSVWKNETYKSRIQKIGDKKWQEFSDETNEVVWNLDERIVEASFVELYLIERNQRVRLFPERLEIFLENEWKWVAKGYWSIPNREKNQDINRQASQKVPPLRTPNALNAEVISVRVIDGEDAQGRPRKIIVSQIKNSGSRAVRVVDGVYIVLDSFGGEIARIPYTILADSDSSTGLKPGEIRDNKSQGYFLPIGIKAASARIEITKVLEDNPSF